MLRRTAPEGRISLALIYFNIFLPLLQQIERIFYALAAISRANTTKIFLERGEGAGKFPRALHFILTTLRHFSDYHTALRPRQWREGRHA